MNTQIKSRVLTLQQLVDLGACESQVELFAARFGDSVDVTPGLCERYATEFDWEWAAGNLLSANAYEAKERSLWEAYAAAEQPLWDTYRDARRSLRTAYAAAERPLLDTYEVARQPLWETYRSAERSLWTAYEAACARTFGELYVSEGAV
jgi:uncharacterized membrane protein